MAQKLVMWRELVLILVDGTKMGESFMGGLVFFFLFLTVDLKGIRVGN